MPKAIVTYNRGPGVPPCILEITYEDPDKVVALLEQVEKRFGTKEDLARDARFDEIIRNRALKASTPPSKAMEPKELKIEGARIPGSWNDADREELSLRVRATSRAAYAKAKRVGKLTTQQRQIVDWIRARGRDATRQEIARGAGLTINATCGRVDELRSAGVLVESGRRACSVTGEPVNALKLAEDRT